MRTDRRKMIRPSSLPTSYEMLEYIENTSTAYIDCGLKPKHTFDYEIKYEVNPYTVSPILSCKMNHNSEGNKEFYLFHSDTNAIFNVGSKQIYLDIKTSMPIYIKFGNYFIENLVEEEKSTEVIFDEKMNGAIITNLFLLALLDTSVQEEPFISKGKIWLLNINDNGKPIRKFIPVKRKSDGMIGMYDLVGRKFYTSPNGVAFTGG